MAYNPKRPCRIPDCPHVTDHKFNLCPIHLRAQEKLRPPSHKRGYDRRWQKNKNWYLKENPLCIECQRAGIIRAATVVDHIIPHKGNNELFWDINNWQALCAEHHSAKTLKEIQPNKYNRG